MFRRKNQPAVDLSRDNILAQYGIMEDGEEDELEEGLQEEEEEEEPGREREEQEGAKDEEDNVEAEKARKRPKLTPAVVVPKLELLTGPAFCALSQCNADGSFKLTPKEWVAKLATLYERWADQVFPQMPVDVFLKRLEKMPQTEIRKELQRLQKTQRQKEDEQAEEEALAAGSAQALLHDFEEDLF